MTHLYSASANGFFSRAVHGDGIPSDAVEVPDAEYADLVTNRPPQLVIVAGADGRPRLQDPADEPGHHAHLARAAAQELLALTDRVALRCLKAGVAYPVEWRDFAAALRPIAAAGDVPKGGLPVQPAFPENT